MVDWTNSGEYLAVAGKLCEIPCPSDHSFRYNNAVKFYNHQGLLVFTAKIPSEKVIHVN